MIDESVIHQCQLKDRKAFAVLYNGTIAYVLSIVKVYIPQQEDQKDVVQEIYAHLFLNIGSFNTQKGTFKFWLRRLIVNQCLMQVRAKKNVLPVLPNDPDLTQMERLAEYQKLTLDACFLEKILAQMPNRFREVLSLVVFEGHSHVEVAKILGITPETSRSQFLRAKKWLVKNTDLKKFF